MTYFAKVGDTLSWVPNGQSGVRNNTPRETARVEQVEKVKRKSSGGYYYKYHMSNGMRCTSENSTLEQHAQSKAEYIWMVFSNDREIYYHIQKELAEAPSYTSCLAALNRVCINHKHRFSEYCSWGELTVIDLRELLSLAVDAYTDAEELTADQRSKCTPAETTTPTPSVKKDKPMTRKFETRHFINGDDATNLSDDDIFTQIAKAEEEIAKLEKIRSKPKKLEARIEEIKKFITELTEYVDNR